MSNEDKIPERICEEDKVRLREILLSHREGATLVSALDHLLATVRKEARQAAFREAVSIIVGQPTSHYTYSGAYPMAPEVFRDNAIKAIEAVIAIEDAKRERAVLEAAATTGGKNDG